MAHPHMYLRPIDPPGSTPRRWRCEDCGDCGPLDQLRARGCTAVLPACPGCGGTPECAIDCPLVRDALSKPGVRVIGAAPAGRRRPRRRTAR